MSKIIDRAGSGVPITPVENDSNLDSLHGINQVIAGATHTVDITDQGDTLEFTNAGAVAVTLDDIATIQGAAHTSDFKVTLIAKGAATVVTITPDASDTINTGALTITLSDFGYVTIQTDSTGAVWNIIRSSSALFLDGLAWTQFIRSDANDTASGDLDLTGAVDLQGTWEIGSTQVDSTAAELNLLNTSVAGTAVASKALVLGATKNIDTIDVAKDGLEIGGTAMTCTAAELNTLDGIASTTAELNITDGDTADSSVTVVDADQLIINDGGTMKQTAMTDIALYIKNENNAGLNTKVVDIGDWNMDLTTTVNIAHSLADFTKVRSVSVMIRSDVASGSHYDFPRFNFSEAGPHAVEIDATNVILTRGASGMYDGTLFDSTSYNRGWITLQYTD